MKFFALLIAAVLLSPGAFAQKKEIVELQRDIALLQDQVRTLQRSQDEKIATLTVLLQQAIDAANKSNTAVAVLQATLNDRFGEQTKQVGTNVANVSGKVDQMAEEFRGVRESISDLSSRMGKLDAKLTDVNNAVRVLSQPPVQPPTPESGGTPGGATGTPGPPGAAPAASTLYESAMRDYSGGRLDLAMQEFQEYLKWHRNTELAPNAQYYIGDLYLRAGDTDNAIKAFDAVLEQFTENNKTPDAHFMKARALFQAGQKTAASKEYCEVVKRFPSTDLAKKSQSALRGMGFSPTCGVAASTPANRRKKR